MIKEMLCLVGSALCLTGEAEARYKEADYVKKHCKGRVEYVLPDRKRVDCLTKEHAIEYDWGHKWAEAIGQSLHYGRLTGKKSGIVLIIKSRKDMKHVEVLRENVEHYKLPITLWFLKTY